MKTEGLNSAQSLSVETN